MLLFLACALAAPVVAIADLENHTGDATLDAVGPGVAGILTSEFTTSGVVEVVERDALQALLAEQQLTLDGLTEPANAAKAGRVLGADYLVVGEMFSLQLPTLSVALRVVDTETGKVVLSRDVVGDIGVDGSRFFQLIESLSDAVLGALDIPADRRTVSSIEHRELAAIARYGQELTRVDANHPRALYRESDGAGWAVFDRRGDRVEMPELARRLGDERMAAAYATRVRRNRRGARQSRWIALGYGAIGVGMGIGGTVMGTSGGDPGRPVQLAGIGLVAASGVHLGVDAVLRGARRRAAKRPDRYYGAADADARLDEHNRELR